MVSMDGSAAPGHGTSTERSEYSLSWASQLLLVAVLFPAHRQIACRSMVNAARCPILLGGIVIGNQAGNSHVGGSVDPAPG